MAFDFPNSPTTNQIISGPGGVQYQWDGTKWMPLAQPNIYAPLASPALTGYPTAPTQVYGDNDTSLATTAFVQSAVSFNDIGRNKLHNPLFFYWQRAFPGSFTTTGAVTADRWRIALNTDTVTVSGASLIDADRTGIGDEEATYALKNVFTGNAAATAYNIIYQPVENVRRLAGKTVTISFWAQAAAGTPKVGVSIDQVFGTGGSPSTTVQVAGSAVTISTTWARYSVTLTLPSIAGKILGSNPDHYSSVMIWYSAGSNNATRSGNVGVQSGTIWLWGMQLEVGSVMTPLEKPDPQVDLANCQRFYQSLGSLLCSGYNTAGQPIYLDMSLPTSLRAAPGAGLTFANIVYSNTSGLAINSAGPTHMRLSALITATGSGYATFDALISADL